MFGHIAISYSIDFEGHEKNCMCAFYFLFSLCLSGSITQDVAT